MRVMTCAIILNPKPLGRVLCLWDLGAGKLRANSNPSRSIYLHVKVLGAPFPRNAARNPEGEAGDKTHREILSLLTA